MERKRKKGTARGTPRRRPLGEELELAEAPRQRPRGATDAAATGHGDPAASSSEEGDAAAAETETAAETEQAAYLDPRLSRRILGQALRQQDDLLAGRDDGSGRAGRRSRGRGRDAADRTASSSGLDVDANDDHGDDDDDDAIAAAAEAAADDAAGKAFYADLVRAAVAACWIPMPSRTLAARRHSPLSPRVTARGRGAAAARFSPQPRCASWPWWGDA